MNPANSALDNDWLLLRASSSAGNSESDLEVLRKLLASPIQWARVRSLAEQHGLQPLLYCTLAKVKESVPPAEMQFLEHTYQSNVRKSLLLARELIKIVSCLSSAGFDVLPYKGLALAEEFYGDIALRPSGDIDLLIRQSDAARVRETLGELGYRPHSSLSAPQQSAYLRVGYECAFDGPAGQNLLEVQWALQPRFYAVDFDMDGLFSRAVTSFVAGQLMKVPLPEDLFIILSLHAAKHGWGRLIWLSDIARILTKKDLNWQWIRSEAMKLGIVRILRITAHLASYFAGATTSTPLEGSLPHDRDARELVEEVKKQVLSGHTVNVESLEYFRLMLRARERRRDRLRFVSRLALTPGPSEWASIELPRPLFPLYRLVRLSRLAGKAIRP
jgi:hypothetical protein